MSPAISSAMACCCLRGSALTLSRICLSRMYDSTLYLERPRSISSMTCRPQPSTKSYSSSTVKGRSCACNSRSTMPAPDAVDVVEGPELQGRQVQNGAIHPGDVGEFADLRPALGDLIALLADVKMHDLCTPVVAQLLGQEDGLIASPAACYKYSKVLRKIAPPIEAVEVDELQKVVPAVLQPDLLVCRVARWIGKGFVLVSNRLEVVGCCHVVNRLPGLLFSLMSFPAARSRHARGRPARAASQGSTTGVARAR